MSPSDIVGPSPVTSNGTETTEIEDEVSEEALAANSMANPAPQSQVGLRKDMSNSYRRRFADAPSQLMMLSTNIPDHLRQSASEEAVSVIHAPESFHSWVRRCSRHLVETRRLTGKTDLNREGREPEPEPE